jgi:hypothetical protein
MATKTESPQPVHTPETKFCIFEYLYRDASNYKAWGEVLLSGAPTENEIAALRASL